jgi:hypothetical protein
MKNMMMIDYRKALVSGSLIVVGALTAGFAGVRQSWMNKRLFGVMGMSVTPLSIMGIATAAIGVSMLSSRLDILDLQREVGEYGGVFNAHEGDYMEDFQGGAEQFWAEDFE